jgi:hypothetical protein
MRARTWAGGPPGGPHRWPPHLGQDATFNASVSIAPWPRRQGFDHRAPTPGLRVARVLPYGGPVMRHIARPALVLLVLTCASALPVHAAEGSAWSATFAPEPLASHLTSPARLLVVPAGAQTQELKAAALALETGLRASGKAPLVMGPEALGPVEGMDDASIARRGASLPVDSVVVLRLFPDASGALTNAVVSLHDTSGQSLGAFAAVAGTPVAAKVETPTNGAMATRPAAQPAALAQPAPVRVSPADAAERYEREYIGFEELVAVGTQTGVVVSRYSVPFEGKYRKPLEGNAFYRKLGRQDLADAYSGKMGLKWGLGIAGIGAAVGGVAFGLTGGLGSCGIDSSWDQFEACRSSAMSKFYLGAGVAIAGAGLTTLAFLLNPHPVTPSEARELADGYNEQLRSDLGLGEDAPKPSQKRQDIVVTVAPVVGPSGAGLQLAGTF